MKKIYFLIICSLLSLYSISQSNTQSLLLDGANDYINIPNNSVLNPTSEITLQAWIKANSWTPDISLNSNYIIGKDEWSTTPVTGYSIRSGGNGKLSFNFASGVSWHTVVSASIMSTNTWHYVTGTFDGSTLKIYIDGNLVGSTSFSGTINVSPEPVTIGKTPYSGSSTPRFFDGKIDQVEIWNIALNQTQINQYMECSPIGNENGLIGFWNFEEGIGTTTTDQTSNGNNGQLMSGTSWSADAQAICVTTSITDNVEDINSIKIYPNPNNGVFYIDSKNDNETLEIANIYGQTILNTELNSGKTKIDLSSYSHGIYIYKLSNHKEEFKTGKISYR